MSVIAPADVAELRAAIADATAAGTRLELRGGGSHAAMGAPRQATIVDMRGFSGIVDYDPSELVLTVKAGTPLAEIETLVAGSQQMLAFEPWDRGGLVGGAGGPATIGGVVAAGVSGPGRVSAGGVRDHLLGFQGVSGRGEHFVGGAKVVKNVTGYDLPKLMAGSWGRLVALTEVTLKVLPRPRMTATMALEGQEPARAVAAMSRAMGSVAEVSAAAHLPATGAGSASLTLFRLQGFEPSVAARCALLPRLLEDLGRLERLSEREAEAWWEKVRTVSPLADAATLWRINLPPGAAPRVLGQLGPLGVRWLLDWAGGLIWIAGDADPEAIRAAAAAAGGHAMLMRAPAALAAGVPMQHPRAPAVARLEARVRRAFDPVGVFETGRFLDETHAD